MLYGKPGRVHDGKLISRTVQAAPVPMRARRHAGWWRLLPASPLSRLLTIGVCLVVPQLLRCARQLAEALRYLHEEAVPGYMVVHRDIKPDNIGFTREVSGRVLALTCHAFFFQLLVRGMWRNSCTHMVLRCSRVRARARSASPESASQSGPLIGQEHRSTRLW